MKKTITFLFALMICATLHSQAFLTIKVTQYGNESSFFINNTCYRALFSVNSETHKPKIVFSGNASLVYNSIYSDATLDFAVFTCPKASLTYLFVHNYADMSRGCDIFLLKNNTYSFIGHLNVAAYTRNDNNKMDYNSILPYISMVNTTQKVYLSFEVPLVVINPGEGEERVLEGKTLHYTIENNNLIQHIADQENND